MTDHHQPATDDGRDHCPPPAITPDAASDPDTPDQSRPQAPGDTVGTGTSIALGCIAGTLLLVVIGLVFLLVVWLIG